ncbi:peroxidase-related enzyme [Aliifodinibius sp. S!AR15-10]|uniref:carboxymuconolactone decarboxylase family protein n=1 Tax=Aliifodinibius sp. S!AR15-10 TaxID=2950437 RepID=UPI002857788D|nr:peroxidase-related enzyme [Aliifodinibius sp. S!AR15-10]MDR8392044.1 peroxidase-related enzyme [Aliifodinibius sp. S!AR15-10]
MAYISVEEGLPGILGLLEFRQDTAKPIRELTQLLLRGPSPLNEGERELIAALVSHRNKCAFCDSAHTATADLLIGDSDVTAAIKEDIDSAPISDKMKALLKIAGKVQQSGRMVKDEDVTAAREKGATDQELHDTVLIAALFSMYNRYVDGLNSWTPENPKFYKSLARRIGPKGYNRPPNGYEGNKYFKTDE